VSCCCLKVPACEGSGEVLLVLEKLWKLCGDRERGACTSSVKRVAYLGSRRSRQLSDLQRSQCHGGPCRSTWAAPRGIYGMSGACITITLAHGQLHHHHASMHGPASGCCLQLHWCAPSSSSIQPSGCPIAFLPCTASLPGTNKLATADQESEPHHLPRRS
jgi:hypothetical protein